MANARIAEICFQHMVTPEEFFGPLRSRHLVAARKAAIDVLREAGLSLNACARLIKRDKSTVYYWVHPRIRDRKREHMRKRRCAA